MSEPARPAVAARPPFLDVDFSKSPFTLAWEITRACGLACIHCRAEAQPRRDPRELTTEEGFDLIEQVVEIGKPILVVTGGDPLMRDDVFDLLERAARRDLRVAFSPSATGRCTRTALAKARDSGISRLHISLDGPDAESHDRFRGVRGSFKRTMEILEDVATLGIPLQIGTTVSRYSIDRLEEISKIVGGSGAVMWSLFFLVPTGRGQASDMVSPAEHEQVFNWLYDLGKAAPFDVRTTAGMHYRKTVIERRRAEAPAGARPGGPPARFANVSGAGFSADAMGMSARGVNDGDGFAFVDHLGNVCPSGFLQLPAGNIREQSLIDIYRSSKLFTDLRDRSLLKGRCGRCEYAQVCGGSRGRAYSLTGDYLESDPACAYEPPVRSA